VQSRTNESPGVLAAIGNTPLVKLSKLAPASGISVFAKMEGSNPGGSIKDRAALQMIEDALAAGVLQAGGLVIESSSGNMAIGLAQVCSYFGLGLICVVDPKATQQNLRILQAYGAHIDLVSAPDPSTGEFLIARLNRVRQLLQAFPGAFWPDQYSNLSNSKAHHRTMAEIDRALSSNIDYLFCSTSTCGTLRGCREYVQNHCLNTIIYAVDAVGSIIFGGSRGARLIPGHGAGVRPRLFQDRLADESILVSDLECVMGCRYLLNLEGILAGGSSGAVVTAFNRVRSALPSRSTCVLILADRGERYLDTIYSDAWVREHFGEPSEILRDAFSARGLHTGSGGPILDQSTHQGGKRSAAL
jgi:cysteine synthase A